MPQIVWTPEAITDVNHIFDYISNDSIYYAEKTVNAIVARTELLERQPLVGKKVRETEVEYYREVFEGKYRIIYSTRHLPDIEIIRVFHSARILNL